MKRIVLFMLAPSIAFLTACATYEADQTPLKPRDILRDIKAVADSNDLTNFDFVGRKLRIDLVQGPEKLVYGNDGQTVLGYGREVELKDGAKEYRRDNFRYGIFRPSGRNFERVIISVAMNVAEICIKQSDLVEVFGKSRRDVNPHLSSDNFSYENYRVEDIRTYFRFEKNGCLLKFGFFQNSNKE